MNQEVFENGSAPSKSSIKKITKPKTGNITSINLREQPTDKTTRLSSASKLHEEELQIKTLLKPKTAFKSKPFQ